MVPSELLSRREAAALRAVRAGTVRRLAAALAQTRPGDDAIFYAALRQCELAGLLQSRRDRRGRRYVLTPAGRTQLRRHARFDQALLELLARSS